MSHLTETRQAASAPATSRPPGPPVEDGRIPFRIRIGVTGHVDLQPTEALAAAVSEQIRWIQDEIVDTSATPVLLAVVSQLAEGADRLVVEKVFAAAAARGQKARLEVILPMPRADYEKAQGFSPDSADEFEQLLSRASWIYQPPPPAAGAVRRDHNAYHAAGLQLLARCDVLIALWNGERSGGKGGTAETLLEAAWRRRPCIWIPTAGDSEVRNNLRLDFKRLPGSLKPDDFYCEVRRRAVEQTPKHHLFAPTPDEKPLQSLKDAFDGLDRFNREGVESGFEARAEELGPESTGADWVAAPFARAADIADACRDRFRWGAWAISVLVTAAAAALAASVSFGRPFLGWVETACLVGAALVFWGLRAGRLHGRWLTARVLAERLRAAAFHVAPTRRDFHRNAGMEAVYTERHSGDWVERASEEVWDRRPHSSPLDDTLPPGEVEEVRDRVARWINGQISYHHRKAAEHRRRDKGYKLAIGVLLILAVAFAMFDAKRIGGPASQFLAIVLPAAGAAVGALATVTQHRALKERSTKMSSDLVVALGAVLDADEIQLGPASLEAARMISAESGDWLGTMWFLDVEHV